MSNVFHSLPQVQNHLCSLRGDQPHSGQRMRGGSDSPGFLSSSSSRSKTTDDLELLVFSFHLFGRYGKGLARDSKASFRQELNDTRLVVAPHDSEHSRSCSGAN